GRSGARGPGTPGVPAGRHRLVDQLGGARVLPAQPVAAAGRSGAPRHRGQPGPAECPRCRPGAAAGLDGGRPGWAGPAVRGRPDDGAVDATRRTGDHGEGGMTGTTGDAVGEPVAALAAGEDRAVRMALSWVYDAGDPRLTEALRQERPAQIWADTVAGRHGPGAQRRAQVYQPDGLAVLARRSATRFLVP